uniref:Uncharacterized protein n=1 Tax=Onchocerca volvulus TaxID=6282 RepID=A0A8R1TNI7_ONCVO
MHDNSTDGIKQLIISNAELETDVEILKDKFERTLEQKCNLEEQKDATKKRERQAALPENESYHRLVEWKEKGTQMENSPAAVRLKPKSTDNDPLF